MATADHLPLNERVRERGRKSSHSRGGLSAVIGAGLGGTGSSGVLALILARSTSVPSVVPLAALFALVSLLAATLLLVSLLRRSLSAGRGLPLRVGVVVGGLVVVFRGHLFVTSGGGGSLA